MRPYARRIELLNIAWILAIFATGLAAWAAADSTFDYARQYVRSLFSMKEIQTAEPVVAAHIALLASFLAYMPFTNILHFFAKHFTFTQVRWDDAPHLKDNQVDHRLKPVFGYTLDWAAPHARGLGRWENITPSMGSATEAEEEHKR